MIQETLNELEPGCFRGQAYQLEGLVPAPDADDLDGLALSFEFEHNRPLTLAGIAGNEQIFVSRSNDWEIRYHRFTAENDNLQAFRMSLANGGEVSREARQLVPVKVTEPGNFRIGGVTSEDWRILKLGRFKSDIPGVFRPSRGDLDLRDASFNAQRVTAGMGVQGQLDSLFNRDLIVCEPGLFIHRDKGENESGLFAGVLDQREHLTSFSLSFDPESRDLREFQISFDYDGIQILPGEVRTSHWVALFESPDESAALARFVELQTRELKLSPPAERLNLFCSWYFYGREFLPEDLEENLAELKKNPIPFDVFIIDNGWIDAFGDFNANEKWPQGMAWAAEKIQAAGMTPGIWTAPFVMMKHSRAAERYAHLIARNRDGDPVEFGYVEGNCYIVDPTAPGAAEYFQEIFSRLRSWGYTYHKLDFVRALAVREDIRFHDPRCNRVMAYRRGLQMIRKALGDGCHILACGGVYDAANYGVADSIRTGSDSIGSWEANGGERSGGMLVQMKQGLVRNYLSYMIQTDPDSLMLRRREKPFRLHLAEKHNWLSDGKFTDEEAFSLVIRQYLGGGNTNVTERLAELPADRRALLRHILPAFGPPAQILDFETSNCPTLALSLVEPQCASIAPWYTLSVSNWEDEPVIRRIRL
ncbi:MAG: TIM-barrel domain-containing protein, partial [Kiritimatiellia bacterium]